jgi:flagellin-like protein
MKTFSGKRVTTLLPQPNYQKIRSLYPEKNMARHIKASRKGISPVIATVILVAVAITVAVSVAYWMGGISSLYTRLEKVEVSSTSISKGTGNYTVTMVVKNTGSADASLDAVYINGKTRSSFTASPSYANITVTSGSYNLDTGTIAIIAGGSITLQIDVRPVSGHDLGAPFTAGTTLDVKLHTAAGKDYPQMVTLT